MSEWMVLIYVVALFAYLMLAARWQPRSVPARIDEQEQDGRTGRSAHIAGRSAHID